MFTQLYHVILYQPIFNLLILFYNFIPLKDIGWAIILITILIKLILYPFSVKSIKAQKALQDLQPKLEEIKLKHKGNTQEMTKATMEMYKKENISPFSSCLPLLIQLPFFIAVYSVFRKGLTNGQNFDILYSFVKNPGVINTWFLGIVDLSKPNLILALVAGLAQFWVSKMLITKKQPAVVTAKDEDLTAKMNKQMLYFMPLMTVFIGFSLPGGLTLYWFFSTILTGVQQLYLFKKKNDVEIINKK